MRDKPLNHKALLLTAGLWACTASVSSGAFAADPSPTECLKRTRAFRAGGVHQKLAECLGPASRSATQALIARSQSGKVEVFAAFEALFSIDRSQAKAPKKGMIAGPSPRLNPQQIALDEQRRKVVVLNNTWKKGRSKPLQEILYFPAFGIGDLPHEGRIPLKHIRERAEGLAVVESLQLIAILDRAGAIDFYRLGAYENCVTDRCRPDRLATIAGPSTQLFEPRAILADSDQIVVADSGKLLIFDAHKSGDAAPAQVIPIEGVPIGLSRSEKGEIVVQLQEGGTLAIARNEKPSP